MQDERQFIQKLAELSQILNNCKVKYLVVGGAAVNAMGYYRPTTDREGNPSDVPDFDFWFEPLYPNYIRLLNAFDDMAIDTSRFREEAHPFPKSSFFRFRPEGYTLDFLPRIGDGIWFHECYQRRSVAKLEGIEISILGIDDLIAAKRRAGRKKDLEDIRVLEEIRSRQK